MGIRNTWSQIRQKGADTLFYFNPFRIPEEYEGVAPSNQASRPTSPVSPQNPNKKYIVENPSQPDSWKITQIVTRAPGKMFKSLGSSAMAGLATAVLEKIEEVKEETKKEVDTRLEQLFQRIVFLKDHPQNIEQAQLQEVQTALSGFLNDFPLILKDKKTGKEGTLTPAQFNQLDALLTELNAGTLDARSITAAHDTLASLREEQMGLIQKVVENILAPPLKKYFGATESVSQSKHLAKNKSRDIQNEISRRTQLETPRASGKGTEISSIQKQIRHLSDLSVKMALVKLIFPHEDSSILFPKIWKNAETLQSGKDRITDPWKAFEKAVILEVEYEFAKNKNYSYFREISVKFHLVATAYVLEKYTQHIFQKIQEDVIDFLSNKNPDERRDEALVYLLKVIVEPSQSHLTTFQSFLKSLTTTPNVLTASIDQMTGDFIKAFKIDGKSHSDVMHLLAGSLVEKYIRSLAWTNTIQSTLETAFPTTQYKSVNWVLYFVKMVLIAATYVVLAPLQWGLDRCIKYGIKWYIVKSALPTLIQSTEAIVSFNSRFQHVINQFLLTKINAFLDADASSRPKPKPLKSSPTLQGKLQGLTDQMLRAISLHHAMTDLGTLQKFFDSYDLFKKMDETISDNISPTVSTELLRVFENFLQDDLLLEFTQYSLENLTKLITEEPERDLKAADIKATEDQMRSAVHDAVCLAVEEAVHTALDPSKKLRDEASGLIEEIQTMVGQFALSCDTINLENFDHFYEEWNRVQRQMGEMTKKLRDMNVNPLTDLDNQIGESFLKETQTFAELMKLIQRHNHEKKDLLSCQKVLEDSSAIFKDLSKSDSALDTRSISNLLQSLETQLESFADLEVFKTALKRFSDITLLYNQLGGGDKDSKTSYLEQFKEFKKQLAAACQHLQEEIDKKSVEMKVTQVKDQTEALKRWATHVFPVSITTKDVTNSLQKFADTMGRPMIEKLLIQHLMGKINGLLDMKTKDYHWEGILWRSIDAYSKLPPRKIVIKG